MPWRARAGDNTRVSTGPSQAVDLGVQVQITPENRPIVIGCSACGWAVRWHPIDPHRSLGCTTGGGCTRKARSFTTLAALSE